MVAVAVIGAITCRRGQDMPINITDIVAEYKLAGKQSVCHVHNVKHSSCVTRIM